MKRGRTPPKPERQNAMKKNTMTRIYNTLKDIEFLNKDEILAELEAELTKGQARKDATATAYAEMWEQVRQALADASEPVTAQEIADETGLTRGKIVYGLTHNWADEVVKNTSGKTTTYALKA